MKCINKISLGTVKLGMPNYGISSNNMHDAPSILLKNAINYGITKFDTSPRYGQSESLIGNFSKNNAIDVSISTKVDGIVLNGEIYNYINESIKLSLERLNKRYIDLLYLHQNEMEIISNPIVLKTLQNLKDRELIKEIGTSIYSEEELLYTLSNPIYDWVQIPCNLFDTYYLSIVQKSNSNIKVAVRSVFLQGLINNSSLGYIYTQSSDFLKIYNSAYLTAKNLKMSLSDLSVAYLSNKIRINEIIVGTLSSANLFNIINAQSHVLDKELVKCIDLYSSSKKNWTNPRNWNW